MRRIRGPEAHNARMALIEGRFPDGMNARCSSCSEIRPVSEGEFVEVRLPGTGHTQVFRCAECAVAA